MTAYTLQAGTVGLDPHEPLTAEHLYYRDIAGYQNVNTRLNADHQEELGQRAKEGDREAREALLLGLQSYVQYWAQRFARAYAWASPRIEFLELVSIGNDAMIRRMARNCPQEHVRTSLAGIAKYAMWQYCKPHASLITTPHDDVGRTFTPHVVRSLDRKLHPDDDLTLGGCIAGPDVVLTNYRPNEDAIEINERNLETLRLVLSSLPERQQEVLRSLYGLDGQEIKTHAQLANERAGQSDGPTSRSWVNGVRVRALRRLRASLGTTTTEDLQALQTRRERRKAQGQSLDPAAQKRQRQLQREADARYRAKVKDDPEKREQQRQKRSARNAAYLAQVAEDPQKHEHYLQRIREYRARKRALQQAQHIST